MRKTKDTYSSKLITFELFRLPTPESALIDQIRQFLLHELFDLGDSLLKP